MKSNTRKFFETFVVWAIILAFLELLGWQDDFAEDFLPSNDFMRYTLYLAMIIVLAFTNVFFDEDGKLISNDRNKSLPEGELSKSQGRTKKNTASSIQMQKERPIQNNFFARTMEYTIHLLILIFFWWVFKWWPASWFGWSTENYFSWLNFSIAGIGSVLVAMGLAVWDPFKLKYRNPPEMGRINDGKSHESNEKRGSSKTAKAALALGAYNAAKARFPTQHPVIRSSEGAFNLNFTHKKKNTYVITFNYIHPGSKVHNLHKQDVSPGSAGIRMWDVKIDIDWRKL